MNKKQIDFNFLPDDIEDFYNGNVHDGEYDSLVFIGRFSPFHIGHKAVVDVALKKAKKVIILVGSSHRSLTERNPFKFKFRESLIRASFTQAENAKIEIRPLRDMTYRDNLWISQVQNIVKTVLVGPDDGSFKALGIADFKIGLIGCEKDSSSYYLKKFPKWGSVGVKFINPLNATDIRRAYFGSPEAWEQVKGSHHLPSPVVELMDKYRETDDFEYVTREIEFNIKNKKAWAGSPYTPTFNAADSMVVQSGHILLVTRRAYPGKGLLALPGGYLDPGKQETLFECSLRELREETKIKVPDKVLRGSMVYDRNFDDPFRSDRGRMLTQAFLYQLDDMEELPKVKGSDDAEKAKFYPINELNEEDFFEDHFHIIQVMLGHLRQK